MATLRTNEVRYALTTRITDLATNTTLGTATRYDWSPITLTIAENSSRTFLSVQLVMSFGDHFTAAGSTPVTGIRMGITLGAAAVTDTDKTFSVATTSHHEYNQYICDVTSYFNTNFGSGTTQTCFGSIAVQSTAASNIGANICAELIITYQFDDSVGTTRTKTIGIPIQSQSTTLTTAQQEIGTDGTTPAPANQIPALDTYLPEASKTYCNAYLEIHSNDESAAVTDFNTYVQIDATTEVARSLRGQALEASGTCQRYRDIFNYDTGTFSTASAHAFKMRSDVTSRHCFAGAMLWVTYTYNASTSTSGIFGGFFPVTMLDNDTIGIPDSGESRGVSSSEKQVFVVDVNVQEPGTITLKQSAIVAEVVVTSTYVGNWIMAAGSQTERTYTAIQSTSGSHFIFHRGDHSSGWSLGRGQNRLLYTLRISASSTRHNLQSIYAYVTWTASTPAQGIPAGTRSCSFIQLPTQAGATSGTATTSYGATLGAAWRLMGCMIQGHSKTGAQRIEYGHAWNAGEYDGNVGEKFYHHPNVGHGQLACRFFCFPITRSCNRNNFATGKFDVTATHTALYMAAFVTTTIFSTMICTFHNITYNVAGTVSDNGTLVSSGTVEIWSYPNTGVDITTEKLTTVTTGTGGTAGQFTCPVPDNTRKYFARYVAGSYPACSLDGTPGSSTFNITIPVTGGGGDVTPPTVTVTNPTKATDPLIVNIYDNVGFGHYIISAGITGSWRYEVYNDVEGFLPPFDRGSTKTGSGTVGSPYIVTIYRYGGWPTGVEITVKSRAIDSSGNETVA